MSKKIIKPHIAVLLLSALLSLTACSSPSEAAQGNTPSVPISAVKSADKIEEVSKTKSGKNISESTSKNTSENTSERKKETSVTKEKALTKGKNTGTTETLPTAQTAAEALSKSPSSSEPEQSAETKEAVSAFKPTKKAVIPTEPQQEQAVSTVSTTVPIITTAEPVTAAPVSATEYIQPTENQQIMTETEPTPEITPEPLFETVSQTLAASETVEPVETDVIIETYEAPEATEAPPALTGGKYQQRYCTQKEKEFADKVFELTNAERLKEGLAPFKKMETLETIACTRAWELTVEYRGDHTRPDATGFTGAFNENGIIYGAWGENIAAGQDSPESVVEAWMNSPSHRAAILDKNYTYMGVGYYYIKDDYQCYYHFWTQEFYCY